MHWNFKVIHIFQYEGATFSELSVLDLQCATRAGIPRCYRHWDFKVLHDFELQGAGKKEMTTKEKKKEDDDKKDQKRSGWTGGGGVGGHWKDSGRLDYLISHIK